MTRIRGTPAYTSMAHAAPYLQHNNFVSEKSSKREEERKQKDKTCMHWSALNTVANTVISAPRPTNTSPRAVYLKTQRDHQGSNTSWDGIIIHRSLANQLPLTKYTAFMIQITTRVRPDEIVVIFDPQIKKPKTKLKKYLGALLS